MQDIKQRELKMQEKRKNTSFHDFLKEICSWSQVLFYRVDGKTSRYPKTNRIHNLCSGQEFDLLMSQNNNEHEYIPGKDFFENFSILRKNQTLPCLWQFGPGIENSDFSDTTYNCKNAYLSNCICFDAENVLYSYHVSGNCKDVLNSVFVSTNSEIIYQSADITNSQKVFFSRSINASHNIRFSSNLTGCQECIACNDLTNQSYCIENQSYIKEEYLKKKKEILQEYIYNKKEYTLSNKNSSLFQCTDVENGIFSSYVSNGRNICFVSRYGEGEKTNLYDTMSSGGQIDHAYGCMGVSPGDNFYCCINSAFCSHVYYSYFLANCSYCLGCIGLKNKQFCIFNKQYSKEEWFELVNKIFEEMEKNGSLGEFFPASINPFYFNDTVASLIDDSFIKEEIEKEGYLWRDEEIKVDIPAGAEVVDTKDLDKYQGFNDKGERVINPEILKKVIKDEKGNFYRIVKMEYDFLMKYGLPLPEIHWLERIKLGFKFK